MAQQIPNSNVSQAGQSKEVPILALFQADKTPRTYKSASIVSKQGQPSKTTEEISPVKLTNTSRPARPPQSASPAQTIPQPNASPAQATPQPNASPARTIPQPNASPARTTLQPNASPAPTTPQPNASPARTTTPQPNASPAPTTPQPNQPPVRELFVIVHTLLSRPANLGHFASMFILHQL